MNPPTRSGLAWDIRLNGIVEETFLSLLRSQMSQIACLKLVPEPTNPLQQRMLLTLRRMVIVVLISLVFSFLLFPFLGERLRAGR
jgi:hypothetical protein